MLLKEPDKLAKEKALKGNLHYGRQPRERENVVVTAQKQLVHSGMRVKKLTNWPRRKHRKEIFIAGVSHESEGNGIVIIQNQLVHLGISSCSIPQRLPFCRLMALMISIFSAHGKTLS